MRMKKSRGKMTKILALAFFMAVALLGVTVDSYAQAAPSAIEHCGGHGSWGGRGGYGGHGCGW